MSKDRAAKSAFIIMSIMILTKIIGFMRETLLAAYYGAGFQMDAYIMAHSIPWSLSAIIGASLGTVFIPMYMEYRAVQGEYEADRFAGNIISITFLFALCLSVIGISLAPQILKWIAPGFKNGLMVLTVNLMQIMFPSIIFITLSHIATGLLQSAYVFTLPALISIPSNIVIILAIALFRGTYGIYALAWSTVIAAASQLFIQLPCMRGRHLHIFRIDFKDRGVLQLIMLLLPLVAGVALDEVNLLVDKIIASGMDAGSISAINYSNTISAFFASIFISPVTIVLYPAFSQFSINKEYDELKNSVARSITALVLILIPVMLFIIIFNNKIVSLIFKRGAFDDSAAVITSYALKFYILGIIPSGIREILVRLFYSLKDTKTPMIVNIIAVGMNIKLNIILAKTMGVGGLGLATSISSLFSAVILMYFFYYKYGRVDVINVFLDVLKLFKMNLSGLVSRINIKSR